jgi:hypothetical protein
MLQFAHRALVLEKSSAVKLVHDAKITTVQQHILQRQQETLAKVGR